MCDIILDIFSKEYNRFMLVRLYFNVWGWSRFEKVLGNINQMAERI